MVDIGPTGGPLGGGHWNDADMLQVLAVAESDKHLNVPKVPICI